MYLPVDQETKLRLPVPDGQPEVRPVLSIASNREKTFVAVVTEDSIYIWLNHPQLILCVLRLSEQDILDRGTLQKVYWRYDSSAIAVNTSRNHILIYQVEVSTENCYSISDSTHSSNRTSQELFFRGPRPSVALFPSVVINLAATTSCCVPLREELFVCIKSGFCHHIAWDGSVHTEFSIRLASVPFAQDQLQTRSEYLKDSTIHAVDAVYAPLIGGYCIVLSDGRAALLTSADSKFHPNSLLGVWAQHLNDAVCAEVNHKYRLLIFGCANGSIAAYHLDEANGALTQTFRIDLKVTDGPELTNRLGPVQKIQVLSNGTGFAAVWGPKEQIANGNGSSTTTSNLPPTLAIFTPFGLQTWSSLESVDESNSGPATHYTSLDWGPEGYRLWLGSNTGLSSYSLARSAGLGNPIMEHPDRLVLMTSSKILISPPREREEEAYAPHAVWTTLNVPTEYISVNWPLRFATFDSNDSQFAVVAGARGMAYCNTVTNKWKIFGNESQERDMIVTGGVFVWDGLIGAACCDTNAAKEYLRFYPVTTKLDNRYVSQTETESRTLMLSLKDDYLVTFDIDSRVFLFKMKRTDDRKVNSVAKVSLERQAEIRVFDLVTHPACLVSIQLTMLNLENGGGSFVPGIDTVLVNVSGRLLTLNPKNTSKDDDERFVLNQPIMVASFVEQIWHDRSRGTNGDRIEDSKDHLTNALWISCGVKGVRVWLPLFSGKRSHAGPDTNFISKRIMLPFELEICPCLIYSRDCLAVGVESVLQNFGINSGRTAKVYSLHRNSEVFVHHLLRQLLKRNLGVFALEVAAACRNLPHFPHSLELLLHGVLEEEATSSEPIPDPLLPRCVAFIQEFPEFLQTIAHCARKTELALWSSLFAVTGPPNDLFEVCLRDGKLNTAASYLIVLQNFENSQTSLEQAARLLRDALSSCEWSIASDMVRFARSIDADDMDNPRRTPPPQKTSSRRPTASLSLNANEANELVFSRFQAAARINKVRHTHEHKDGSRKDSTGSGKKVGRALSNDTGPPSPISLTNPMAEKMDSILQEHAASLLDEYSIRDLGFLCALLHVDICKIISHRRIVDFPTALTRVHSQFSWPYPIAGKHVVDQLEKRFGALRTSQSAVSLNDVPTQDSSPPKPNGQVKVYLPSPSETSDTGESVEVGNLVQVRQNSQQENETESPSSPTPNGTNMAATPDSVSLAGDWQGVDVLMGESTSKGPTASQMELSFLMQIFSDSAAIDWLFLLCLVCRDIGRLRREVTADSLTKWGIDAFGQTRLGAQTLMEWAVVNCQGYVSVLQLFIAHLDIVASQGGCLNLPPRQASSRLSNGTTPTSSKTALQEVPRRAVMKNGGLNSSYKSRERSRSVDRTSDHVVSSAEAEEGCSIM